MLEYWSMSTCRHTHAAEVSHWAMRLAACMVEALLALDKAAAALYKSLDLEDRRLTECCEVLVCMKLARDDTTHRLSCEAG